MTEQVPRFRLPKDIDLSKARNHSRCNGTGVMSYLAMENPENPSGPKMRVPVICRCVVRAGGVKKDSFDRMNDDTARQVNDGTFAQNLASDVGRLPPEAMIIKIQELKRDAFDKRKPTAVRKLIRAALQILEQEA